MNELREISDLFQVVVTFAGGLLVLVQAFTKFNPLNRLRSWLIEPAVSLIKELKHENKSDHEELYGHYRELQANQLKLIITSENMPIEERLVAGDIYVNERGLNGKVKAQYNFLNEEYKKQLETEKKDKQRKCMRECMEEKNGV